MSKVEYIDLFGGLNINPIPLEFENSLTTTEFLCALQKKVNLIVDVVNEFEQDANAYTDEKILEIRSDLTEINKRIDDSLEVAENYTNEEISKLKVELMESITNIEAKVQNVNSRVDATNTKIEELEREILGGNMIVVSPVTGSLVSIQTALYDIYNSIRVTITWADIEALNLNWDDVERWDATWLDVEFNITNYITQGISTMSLETNSN